MSKMKTYSPEYCIMDHDENMLYLIHMIMWHHSNTFIILCTVKIIVKFPNHKIAYNVIKTLMKFYVRDLEKMIKQRQNVDGNLFL